MLRTARLRSSVKLAPTGESNFLSPKMQMQKHVFVILTRIHDAAPGNILLSYKSQFQAGAGMVEVF